MSIPTPDADTIVYAHPAGKQIHVAPDGTMTCYKPDGKRGTTSATPEKLAAGHGGWQRISGEAPEPFDNNEPVNDEPPSTALPRIPMTYSSAEITDLDGLARQDDVVLEQKLDGTRALAVVTSKPGGGSTFVRFLGRNGQTLSHAAAAQHFKKIAATLERLFPIGESGEIVLDGEIMTDSGEYWVFDLPYMRIGGGIEFVRPTDTYQHRRRNLAVVAGELARLLPMNVRLVPTFDTPAGKRTLISRVREEGGEGIMVKHVLSPYEPGKRAVHSLKVKFVHTADVVVLRRDVDGAKNAVLGVAAADDEQSDFFQFGGVRCKIVGNCSMIGKPDAQPGDVIEVKYLYLASGGRLYQPRMERLRPDREPASCTADQFRRYSRAVLI